jgi:ATP-dependent Clp protease protease subunit
MADQPESEIEMVYATLEGAVDAQMVRKVFEKGAALIKARVKTLHLLVHSTGGFIGDGVAIHNYIKHLPMQVVTYNAGQVSSIAVLVYLAGTVRQVSEGAIFLIHKSHITAPGASTVSQLEHSMRGLNIDDDRTEAIFRNHVNLPPEYWEIHKRGELVLTASEAVKFGLSHAVGYFRPPAGATTFNVLQ